MLKEQLIQEASTINFEVKLDDIFESVSLSDEVKAQFQVVFDTTVKKQALALAESHVTAIAEKAEVSVAEEVEKRITESEQKLKETCDSFFEHLAQEWLKENAVEVDKSIKTNLFESMFVGLKELFVEHNVVLPTESVDVVAEMEEQIEESKQVATGLFEQLQASKAENIELKRTALIKEATQDLTLSQREKVESLIEGVEFDDKYATKLTAMVEMAKTRVESNKPADEGNTDLNEGINYKPESAEPATPAKTEHKNPMMSRYLQASQAK